MTRLAGAAAAWVNTPNQWPRLWGKGEGGNRFVHFYKHDFSYRWLNKRVEGRARAPKPLFCLLSLSLHTVPFLLSFPLHVPWLKAVDTTVLSSAASLSARVVYFRLYLEQRPGPEPWVWSRAVAPGDKADRDTVTCVSVVRVGMDGDCSTIKQLPLRVRWIGSGSHSCGGRRAGLFKGADCSKFCALYFPGAVLRLVVEQLYNTICANALKFKILNILISTALSELT